ncbi:RIKEN cDNA 2810046M22 [Mus musculus]|nr:RIKEN cDNA 2810046M22 [Mus musculus]
MMVLCASGTYVVSSRCHLCHAGQQPSVASHVSLATRWPVQPQCPYSQPEWLERRRLDPRPVSGHAPALMTFPTVEEETAPLVHALNQGFATWDTSSQGRASSSDS